MHLLIIDNETTGKDRATDRIVEVGAILYSVEHATPIVSYSSLVQGPDNAAEGINGIPSGLLKDAPSLEHVLGQVDVLVNRALKLGDAVFVAHGVEFDRGFLEMVAPDVVRKMPWACSLRDISWPRSKAGASCVTMALAHGVTVSRAHRALTDCELIARTCEAVQADKLDLRFMIGRALRPKVLVIADTPKPWEMRAGAWPKLKEELRTAGFTFDDESKRWSRRMPIEDTESLPFPIWELDE